MTTSIELIERIKTALADDNLISAWCTQNFGRAHTVLGRAPRAPAPVITSYSIHYTKLYEN